METNFVISYRELKVYQTAIDNAMQIFEASREFPTSERELLTAPLIRSSRLVCIYISQAWQRRRYQSAFVARLNQAEAEAAATQVWIEFAVLCDCLNAEVGQELHHDYRQVLSELARLIRHAPAWVIPVKTDT